MTSPDMPKDGDFASYIEEKRGHSTEVSDAAMGVGTNASAPADAPRQTLEQILVEGQEPTEAFLEEWIAGQAEPELSDEELERQALEAPGEDGDPSTPE